MNFINKFFVLGCCLLLVTCASRTTSLQPSPPRSGTWDQGSEFLKRQVPPISRDTNAKLSDLAKEIPSFGGLVFTQTPSRLEGRESSYDRSRIMLLTSDDSVQSLTTAFVQASDPDVSFDGKRLLFSGKKAATDFWQIFEINVDGSNLRQITNEPFDCRHPIYQSTMYVITSTEPWEQITFAGQKAGQPPSLYSCRMDGSALRQLTFNPHGANHPYLMRDGRILYSAWKQPLSAKAQPNQKTLFSIHSDGTDVSLFTGDEGGAWKHSPVETSGNLVIFIEPDTDRGPDGPGRMASVNLRRAYHSYHQLSQLKDGLFQTPSALPNGEILVSHQYGPGFQTFGIHRFNPKNGKLSLIHDDPASEESQPRLVAPRPVADGRSSVVNEAIPTGQLYCLSAHTTDLPSETFDTKQMTRIRVVEGRSQGDQVHDHLLGEVPIEKDGSFNVRVPANLPISLEALDESGKVLGRCGWIWVKNNEPRGCIGCHEDAELTPENIMPDALRRDSVDLVPPSSQRKRLTDESRHQILRTLQEGEP